ncbi:MULTISPECIES: XopAW family type III secretion system calcium-binding effector [unclassified Pseudomonas]|jgi:Ca2+-binding EF-hand superfamily protein|uniref:XopAW family type III secretion system calcium-binding effector n=1 Tax=unclassified Pseudomonas TaxID=196821 RepID=UPI00069DF43F|nr:MULTISPECIES: XopAW family type III secretion system calcium-binding effector [unclassified Pseudomonas]WPN48448.1 XopAW family type III secretion system calcium-binding effector [Pseudomonas sp. P8_241]
MIGSISNYTSYTSTNTSNAATNSARSQQFQEELLARLDSNSDGSVDQDELGSALSQKSDDGLLVSLSENFADLDSDESGSLSSEEMAAMAPPPPPPGNAPADAELADALISALDANGDGVISSDELNALQASDRDSSTITDNSTTLFTALDSDGSGGVSSDELITALKTGREQNTDSTSAQSSGNEALQKMIANLSKLYSLDNVTSVGIHLNVAA